MSCHSALPWPLATIDFEASSLDPDGYPVEVGLAVWPAPGKPVLSWSALIRPTWHWTSQGHWSPASTRVHGIRSNDLAAHGLDADRIAPALNAVLGAGTIAWCDGGGYDAHWLQVLFGAGGAQPTFALGDWHQLASLIGKPGYERACRWLDQTLTPHRARPDAERLLHALAHGAGLDPVPAGNLDVPTGTAVALAGALS